MVCDAFVQAMTTLGGPIALMKASRDLPPKTMKNETASKFGISNLSLEILKDVERFERFPLWKTRFQPIWTNSQLLRVFNGFQPWSMLIDVDNVCGARLIPPRSLSTAPVRRERLHRNRRKTDEKIEAKKENTMENVWFWQFWAGSFLDCLDSLILKHADVFTYLYIDVSTVILCDSLWFSVTCRYGVAEARQIFGGNAYTRSGLGEKVWLPSDRLMSDALDEL